MVSKMAEEIVFANVLKLTLSSWERIRPPSCLSSWTSLLDVLFMTSVAHSFYLYFTWFVLHFSVFCCLILTVEWFFKLVCFQLLSNITWNVCCFIVYWSSAIFTLLLLLFRSVHIGFKMDFRFYSNNWKSFL